MIIKRITAFLLSAMLLIMSVSFSVSAGYANPKEHITDEFLQKARNLINSYVGYGNVLNAYNGLKDMGYEFSDIDDFTVLWNMLGSVRVLPATDAELRALFNSMSDANLNNWLDYVGVGLFGGGSTRGGGGGFSSKDAETLNLNDIIEQYKPIFTIPASDARVVSLSQYINLVDNVFGISSLKSTKTTLASLVRGREFGDVTYATYFDYTTYYPQVTYNPNYHYYLATITSDKLYASDKNGLSVVGVMTGYTPSYAGLGILNKYEYTLTKAGSNVYQVFTSSFDNSNKAVQTVSSIGTSLLVNHNLSFAIYDDTAYSKEIDYNFSTEITNNFNNITNNYYDFFYSDETVTNTMSYTDEEWKTWIINYLLSVEKTSPEPYFPETEPTPTPTPTSSPAYDDFEYNYTNVLDDILDSLNGLRLSIVQKFDDLKAAVDSIPERIDELKNALLQKLDDLKTAIDGLGDSIANKLESVLRDIFEGKEVSYSDVDGNVQTKREGGIFSGLFSSIWDGFTDILSAAFIPGEGFLEEKFNGYKAKLGEKMPFIFGSAADQQEQSEFMVMGIGPAPTPDGPGAVATFSDIVEQIGAVASNEEPPQLVVEAYGVQTNMFDFSIFDEYMPIARGITIFFAYLLFLKRLYRDAVGLLANR